MPAAVHYVHQVSQPEFTEADDGSVVFETIFEVRFYDMFPVWSDVRSARDPITNLRVPFAGDQFPNSDSDSGITPYVTTVAWSQPSNDSPNLFRATITSKHDLYTGRTPSHWRTRYTWSTDQFQIPAEYGRKTDDSEGQLYRVVNRAGDPYDPPQMKYAIIDVCSFEIYVTTVGPDNVTLPDWLFSIRKKLNNATFTIDGRTVQKGNAMVFDRMIGPQAIYAGGYYRPVQIILHIASTRDSGPTNLMQPEIQEQGYQQKIYVDEFGEPITWPADLPGDIQVDPDMQWKERICLADGIYPSSPQLLDAYGRHLRGPRTASDDEWQAYALDAKTRWYIHEYCDFSPFVDLTNP